MKKALNMFFYFSLVVFLVFEVKAFPTKIISGEIFLGGTSYGTPDYQTYLRFYVVAQTRMPRREYALDATQRLSVYLNHLPQPDGDFDYNLVMPYSPQRMLINDELFSPVWFSDCVWKIKSYVRTPEATPESPQFVTVTSFFTMTGSSVLYGAYTSGFKINGNGTSEFKFEKINNKYYLLEARYVFSNNVSNPEMLLTK